MSRTRPSLPLAGPTQWPGDPFRLWKTRWWTRAVLPGVLTRWSELEVTLPCRYIYLHLRTHYIIAFFLDEFLEATHFEASTFSREKKKEKEWTQMMKTHVSCSYSHSGIEAWCRCCFHFWLTASCFFVCLFFCLFVCFFVCLFVCLFVHTFGRVVSASPTWSKQRWAPVLNWRSEIVWS